jgi:hypothetical protein
MDISKLTQAVRGRQGSEKSTVSGEIETLERFLEAATTFQTNASTIASEGARTVLAEVSTLHDGSVFGEPLSQDRVGNIERWNSIVTKGDSTGFKQ